MAVAAIEIRAASVAHHFRPDALALAVDACAESAASAAGPTVFQRGLQIHAPDAGTVGQAGWTHALSGDANHPRRAGIEAGTTVGRRGHQVGATRRPEPVRAHAALLARPAGACVPAGAAAPSRRQVSTTEERAGEVRRTAPLARAAAITAMMAIGTGAQPHTASSAVGPAGRAVALAGHQILHGSTHDIPRWAGRALAAAGSGIQDVRRRAGDLALALTGR